MSVALGDSLALAREQRRTVKWATVLFVLVILVQRFSVPGMPVPMLLPVVLGWVFLALRGGVLEVDRRRFLFWCLAVCATGGVMLVQTAVGTAPMISLTSWALVLVVWLPALTRFTDRRTETYRQVLVAVAWTCTALAAVCIVQMAIQLAGFHYSDILKPYLPATFLEQGFNITSPVEFGSTIYRANAWIGLEASVVSYQIGIGLLAAVLTRRSIWMIGVLVTGLFATVAGSGFLLALVGVLTLLVTPARRILLKPIAPIVVLGGALAFTPYGQGLITRTGEASQDEGSSASLRAIQPYSELWPTWSTDLWTALVGGGPGSSQRLVDLSPLRGLVPLPAKIFFDYGLVAGIVLALFLLYCYVDGPSQTFAFTMFVSMWTVQPGSNIPVFVIPLVLLVTLWAPRAGPRLEDLPLRRRTPDEEFGRLRAAHPRRLERMLGT
jgi:hypothetical protein